MGRRGEGDCGRARARGLFNRFKKSPIIPWEGGGIVEEPGCLHVSERGGGM